MGHQSDAIWDHRLGFQIAKDSNGIDQVLLRVPRGASARISLYGGQVVSWKNNRGEELLFTTRSRNKAMGKQAKTKGPNSINATNGGIPICFQQFGNSGCLEQHGFVSTQMWAVDHDPLPLKASNGYNGVVSVVDLVLKPSDDDNKFWPQRFEIRLRVSLAMNGSLSMISRVRNLNGKAFRFKFAYHTYLSVSDISEVRIEGLETLDYLDNLLSQQRLTEQGDAITFESEVDRVYLNSPNMIVVLDHERKRTIVMRKDGLPDWYGTHGRRRPNSWRILATKSIKRWCVLTEPRSRRRSLSSLEKNGRGGWSSLLLHQACAMISFNSSSSAVPIGCRILFSMDGFQRLGEVYGSLQALMVFQDEIEINPNQCLFLFHILDRAFDVVSTEIQHNLRLRDHRCKTNLKWTALEHPLVELVGIFRGAEMYIAQCIQSGADFYAKAISLTYNNDVLEYHVYKLLSCLPVVMEALDYSFTETEIMCTRKKILAADNYDKEWLDPKLFQIRFGKRYLVSADMVGKLEMICREDRWNLMETIDTNKNKKKKKKKNPNQNKDQKLAEMLTGARGRFLPTSSLVGSKDYKIKRRLGGNGSHLKEIEWRGMSFVVRHILGDVKALVPEIKLLLPLSHPNIINIFCAFSDESKKECFLLMELMDKDLCSYIKEKTSSRSRHIFSLPVAVDLMVQIGRGMEYLHSNQIPHGNLNPSKILVKPTCNNAEDLHVKITGFGVKSFNSKSEKEDVYSFGKICSMLITGKYPSEGDSVSFLPPSPPKYLTHFIRWCLNSDPSHRPNFSSICRILRYVKRFLLLNPNHSRPYAPVPVVDYHELESSLCQRFSSWSETSTINVTEVPFQMFSYKVMEMEMIGTSNTINWSDSGSEENYSGSVTPAFQSPSRSPSPRPTSLSPGKSVGRRAIIGNQNPKKLTSTSASPCLRRFDTRTNSDGKLPPLSRHSLSPQQRKRMTHHVSDSEFV